VIGVAALCGGLAMVVGAADGRSRVFEEAGQWWQWVVGFGLLLLGATGCLSAKVEGIDVDADAGEAGRVTLWAQSCPALLVSDAGHCLSDVACCCCRAAGPASWRVAHASLPHLPPDHGSLVLRSTPAERAVSGGSAVASRGSCDLALGRVVALSLPLTALSTVTPVPVRDASSVEERRASHGSGGVATGGHWRLRLMFRDGGVLGPTTRYYETVDDWAQRILRVQHIVLTRPTSHTGSHLSDRIHLPSEDHHHRGEEDDEGFGAEGVNLELGSSV
jgi:hypothetical protein